MILDDTEVESRLVNENNLCVVIRKGSGLGGERKATIPGDIRALVGKIANEGSKSKDIEEEFGVSQATVSKSSHGLVGNRYDEALARAVSSGSERVEKEAVDKNTQAHESALDIVMLGLEAIKPRLVDAENLSGIKTKDLSRIVSDMSKVAGNLRGGSKDEGSGSKTQVVVVINGARKNEDDYDAIVA